ncbi:STAS domain-containing protein [Pseudosulfitobacter sp. DSM 107133]|jgi:chemotaxis protein CheX|uniref:STAS domain-containing protein n=1 Tax=Pseudosulfitobacter sp. DSM 107133 TaxID=2883100 RepID=UPI000DF3FCCD|nr:STAS domain-containing protein [Pseudosulfitobacter sp. DSM 107133]UOA27257.1 hypothetical protein DSM107133_01980 [Pseudosulfitobacter sp. DSM 107133]
MADPIVLPPRLDLSSVPDVLSALKSAPDTEPLVLDAGNVIHFGALGLQMVIALTKSMGDRVQLTNVTDKGLEQLHWMGMTPEKITEAAQ